MANLPPDDYWDTLERALALPTWLLRRWERKATKRASVGAPPRREIERLQAVRHVLANRDAR